MTSEGGDAVGEALFVGEIATSLRAELVRVPGRRPGRGGVEVLLTVAAMESGRGGVRLTAALMVFAIDSGIPVRYRTGQNMVIVSGV